MEKAADYLVVIYQEGKVISLGTYWEEPRGFERWHGHKYPGPGFQMANHRGHRRGAGAGGPTDGLPRRKVPGQEFISRGWQPAVSESFPDKGNDRRPDLCVD